MTAVDASGTGAGVAGAGVVGGGGGGAGVLVVPGVVRGTWTGVGGGELHSTAACTALPSPDDPPHLPSVWCIYIYIYIYIYYTMLCLRV
jgi:hypothetical protein